jgi:hypothetical protein
LFLVEGVDGEAAEELGVEVGGLLGHDVSCEGDIPELVERDGLDEECDVGVALGDHGDGLVGLADVTDAAEASDGLLVEAEELVEDDAVELDDVELALARGQVFEFGGDDVGLCGQQITAVDGDGDEGSFGCLRERRCRASRVL